MDRQVEIDEIRISGEQNLPLPTNPEQEEQIQLRPHPACWKKLLYSDYWVEDRTLIPPIGYDWKIGICGLIASFAAREVFVLRLLRILQYWRRSRRLI